MSGSPGEQSPARCEISVIVPTYREAANVAELARRLFAALCGSAAGGRSPADVELIIVDDDSRDGIERVVAESPHRERIRLLVRRGQRGLASAVLHGLAQARGRYLVVMDADLSHPPEVVGELLRPLLDSRAEMVVGSRYLPGASTEQRWGAIRRLNSRVATWLARPFARVSDPMSGFFAISRATLDRADHLNPTGYKIGLELLVKCRCRGVAEVPIHFADRRRGRSKLTFAEQLRYVEHLSRLYDFRYPRLVPVAKFLIIIALGSLGGWLWLGLGWLLTMPLPDGGLAGPGRGWVMAAYWPAVAINLLAYWRYIKQMKGLAPIRRPVFDFLVISGFEWLTYLAGLTLAGVTLDTMMASRPVALFGTVTAAFAGAFFARFVLRKLAGHDIRGLPARRPEQTGP